MVQVSDGPWIGANLERIAAGSIGNAVGCKEISSKCATSFDAYGNKIGFIYIHCFLNKRNNAWGEMAAKRGHYIVELIAFEQVIGHVVRLYPHLNARSLVRVDQDAGVNERPIYVLGLRWQYSQN